VCACVCVCDSRVQGKTVISLSFFIHAVLFCLESLYFQDVAKMFDCLPICVRMCVYCLGVCV